MTDEQAAMVAFLRDQYASSLQTARDIKALVSRQGLPSLGVEAGSKQASQYGGVHAAETRIRFLNETVVPYLGTAGPTGRIADQQLRLLALERAENYGYDDAWRP